MTHSRLLRLIRFSALFAGLLVSVSDALADGPAKTTLPRLTKAQVEARLKKLLLDASDLSAYIVQIDDDGTVHAVGQPRLLEQRSDCGNTPPKTTTHHPITNEQLQLSEKALTALNTAVIAGHVRIVVEMTETACGDPK
jgi:hypothetical protein